MPPAPSDLLGGDVKRLEDSNQRIAARLDGVEAGVRDLREEFARFRGRVDANLAFMKWLGVFVAGILVAVIVGSGRVVWDASAINSEVKQQGKRLDEVTSEVKQQGKRLDEVTSEVKQQGTRLERVEKRLDGIEKQLEILIRRSEPKSG